jgi:hypothetical protein
MSKQPETAAAGAPDRLLEAESNLGQALAVIHRLLPRLDVAGQESEVQAAFKRAAACLESARSAYQQLSESRLAAKAQVGVPGETLAAISAAIAIVLGRPYRLVSVQKVPVPVPHLNVWALEGRTQIFQSHKIR